jgi:hypothetical protein
MKRTVGILLFLCSIGAAFAYTPPSGGEEWWEFVSPSYLGGGLIRDLMADRRRPSPGFYDSASAVPQRQRNRISSGDGTERCCTVRDRPNRHTAGCVTDVFS